MQQAGLADQLMTPSTADAVLRAALPKGKTPADVPEWEYSLNNCAAAQHHYVELSSGAGAKLDKMSSEERIKWVDQWLRNAVSLVSVLRQKQLVSLATDTSHQQVWLDVFEEWRSYAKQ
jgi:hypothetical protein